MRLGVAVYDLARPERPRTAQERPLDCRCRVRRIPAGAGQLRGTRAIQKALSLPLFGTILHARRARLLDEAVEGARAFVPARRGAVQFVAFYRSLVIACMSAFNRPRGSRCNQEGHTTHVRVRFKCRADLQVRVDGQA